MNDPVKSAYTNVYKNQVTGATSNPIMSNPGEIDEAFVEGANKVLSTAKSYVLLLVLINQQQLLSSRRGGFPIRKFFSLSEKYAAWAAYQTLATGYGIHGWVLEHNKLVRLI